MRASKAGLKCRASTGCIALASVSGSGRPSCARRVISSVARLLVRNTTVLLKSMMRPSPSASVPLSKTW
ncbi:hypothetical protein D3C73_1486600 [compost metagenome]